MNWQRSNVQAAAAYLRELIGAGADDTRTKIVYEGLLEVLEPARRATRLQREGAQSAKAAVVVQTNRERRSALERRGHHDRRLVNLGPTSGAERRSGRDRRTGRERRGR